MPPRTPAEVMMPVPEHDALTMAHIEAIRALSGQVSMLNGTVAGMAADMKATRESVLKLEAQELKTYITNVRTEAIGAVDKLREDHDADIEKVDLKADNNARALSRIQGIFLPLAALGAGILAFLGEYLANVASGIGGLPPHHP